MKAGWNLIYTSLLASSMFYMGTGRAGVEFKELQPNPNDIQVVPVERSPEANRTRLYVQYPNDGEVEQELPIDVETRIDWFPLGLDSGDFPRRKEIRNNEEGQCLRIFIDNYHFFPINEALFDALDDHDEFFDQISEFKIPYKLSPGMHVLRAFPCRSFGESLKTPNSSTAITFYYKQKEPALDVDLKKPYLTYNEPQGTFSDSTQPILLDFYINNCTLSRDGYKVRVTIDGTNQRFLYDWVPYYIYGLGKGTHTLRLELINPQNELQPGVFNHVSRTFTIE